MKVKIEYIGPMAAIQIPDLGNVTRDKTLELDISDVMYEKLKTMTDIKIRKTKTKKKEEN